MNEELISVIVPVYRVEEYLPKCIESILAQTYENLQIILVDDGSPDRCGEICDLYAEKDPRITVIHKQNGGLSDARNAGLDICRGTYVTFVDSDDSIEPEYAEYLYRLIRENNADLAVCGYRYLTESGAMLNRPTDDGSVLVMNTEKALEYMCDGKLFSVSAWAKLYRTEHFAGIRYPKGRIYEDLGTTYKLVMRASKVVLGQRLLYRYLYRFSGISKQPFHMGRMDALIFTQQMCRDICTVFPRLTSVCQKMLFTEHIYLFKAVCSGDEAHDALKKSLYESLVRLRKDVNRKALTPKLQAYYFASCFGIRVFSFASRIETWLYNRRLK